MCKHKAGYKPLVLSNLNLYSKDKNKGSPSRYSSMMALSYDRWHYFTKTKLLVQSSLGGKKYVGGCH
jgi:hypothetical protein